jgi:RimJ/RimL family protein N-acetyltransferase
VEIRRATIDDLELVARWLAEPTIAKWLDFGPGRDSPSALALKVGMTRGTDVLFTFAPHQQAPPVGVVGLSNIHHTFRTATLWYALGDARHGRRGLTTCAAAAVLRIAFDQLKLEAINAWTVPHNRASLRILQKIGFSLIGRQRRCHSVDGPSCDRLLFDILPSECLGALKGFSPSRTWLEVMVEASLCLAM